MAEGVVDRLVIATEFDESGLDRGTKAQLAHLERFVAQVGQISRSLPPITVDATQITTALAQAGGDLEAFARILSQLSPADFVAALDAMVLELGEAGGQFKATSVEAKVLQGAIDFLKSAQTQALGATQAATTALTQEAGAARLTANAATDLVTALERTGVATRQLASQSTQPIALNVQPAINAADTLISRMGLAQRSVTSVRQVLATPMPPIPPDPNLPVLTSGYIAQTAAVQRLAAQNVVAARSVNAVAAAMSRASSGALAWAVGAAKINEAQQGLNSGMALSTQQASKLRSGLTALAVSATGASGPVGQLAQSLLLFGGTGAVAGVAAAVLAVAAAYRFFTTAAREAREEQDRLVESLLAQANSAIPKAVQAQAALTAAVEAERRARAAVARLQLGTQQVRSIPIGGAASEIVNEELIRRQIAAIKDADRAQQQALENQKRATIELNAITARSLTESINLRGADAAQIRTARDLVLQLIKTERDTTLTLGEQLDIYRQRVDLQKALTGEAQHTLNFFKQFRAAENQILDAQIQLVRLGFGDPSILTKALREAAATARDLTATEEDRIAAANRLNAAAAALVAPLERQVQATGASADNIIRAFRATQSLSGLDAVLGLTADSSQVTAEIAKAERELAALRAQAVNLRIDGDAAPVLRSIAVVEARLADLRTERAQITLTGDASGLTQQITEAETQLARLRAQGVALALTADPSQLIRQIDEAEARLQSLRSQGGLIQLAGDTGTSPLARQIADLDAALGRLRASGGAATDTFRQMQQQRTGLVEKQREAEQLVASFQRIGQEPLELKFEARLDLGNPDQALAALLKELQQRADERVFGLTLKALRVPVEVDTSLLGDADRAIEALNTDLARQNPIWREANAQAAKMARHLDDNRTNAERFADELDGVLRGIGDIAGAASNIGLIGDEASRAIGDVLNLGDAIGQVVKEASTANILGLIGAGLNVLGSLFGGGESEHDRIVRENTEAIKRNTASRSTEFAGIGGADELATKIGQLLDTKFAGAVALSALPGGLGLQGQEEVERQLRVLGLTLEDLDRAAQVHNLDVLDEKGRLVAGALQQLEDAILADIQASLKFADTLSDLTLRDDLRAQITGEAVDPTAAFQRTILAAGELGASEITRFFEGIDLGDPDALRKASLGLLDAFENGQLDAAKLGKLSREDILRILGDAAGLIESLGDSALDAANELSIIPKGFRTAALAFEAQIPGLGPNARIDLPTGEDLLPDGLEIGDADVLNRLFPQPILISGAELLDRLVTIGAIPATTGLPAGLPSDGAALPQVEALLGPATAILDRIAATLGEASAAPAAQVQTNQELSAAVARLMELLAKAKIGQSFGDIILQLPSTGQDAYEQAVDVRRALEDISMADYGRTDRWGQT